MALDTNDDLHMVGEKRSGTAYPIVYATVPSSGKGTDPSCNALSASRWRGKANGPAYVKGARDSDRDGAWHSAPFSCLPPPKCCLPLAASSSRTD